MTEPDGGSELYVLSPKGTDNNIVRSLVDVQNKRPHAQWRAGGYEIRQ